MMSVSYTARFASAVTCVDEKMQPRSAPNAFDAFLDGVLTPHAPQVHEGTRSSAEAGGVVPHRNIRRQ